MKKNVWIMNHYAGDTYFDHGGRHYYFAKFLKQSGYAPVVFCANSMHDREGIWFEDESLWHEHHEQDIDVPYVFIKARPYRGNGRQRIINMIDFYCNVKKAIKEYANSNRKPDVIYASSVHPLTLVAGIHLAKYFGVKCICEVRDLWPESIVAYGLAGKSNPAVIGLRILEKWIYQKADHLIFTMEGGYDYISEQRWDTLIPREKTTYINNGVDIAQYERNSKENTIQDEDLDCKNTFKVVYAGSIRKANGLEQLIECASRIKECEDVRFLVYGQGEDLDLLREQCRIKSINNVVFKGSVPKSTIPNILSRSNLNLLNYNSDTVNVYRFGSSQNKLFEYLASGKPIVSNVSIAYSVIETYNCGISKNLPTGESYADAVLRIYQLPAAEYQVLCDNARNAAKEFDFYVLTEKLIAVIEKV